MRRRSHAEVRLLGALRLGVCATLACLIVTSLASHHALNTYAAGNLDQSQVDQTTAAVLNSVGMGFSQTFTAGATGNLDQLELPHASLGGVATYVIEIRDVVGGEPGPTVLTSATQSSAGLPVYSAPPIVYKSFPLSPAVPVVAGMQYAISLRLLSGGSVYLGAAFNPYVGGQMFFELAPDTYISQPTYDMAFRTYVSPFATATPTMTVTSTATATVPTAIVTTTATPIATPLVTLTATPAPAGLNDPNNQDERQELSEAGQRQRQHTNQGNRDDIATEGNVIEVRLDATPPHVVLANRDGPVTVRLLCGSQCPTIQVGDYIEVEGEKQHEQLFDAEQITVTRGR